MSDLRIGTAGWQIPRAVADRFPAEGSTLERYAARLDCAEINTSFYRPHKAETWIRWADSTPDGFLFAVKAPKAITHERRLVDCGDLLDAFLAQTAGLGRKLGPILVQLPPALAFDADVLAAFLVELRARHGGDAVFEPRHPSWFTGEADAMLAAARVARAAADPARVRRRASRAAGRASPTCACTDRRASTGRAMTPPVSTPWRPAERGAGAAWCVFDNTASGAAAANALDLRARL